VSPTWVEHGSTGHSGPIFTEPASVPVSLPGTTVADSSGKQATMVKIMSPVKNENDLMLKIWSFNSPI